MTVALRRGPDYADGCRGGHRMLEFIEGQCFTCGRGPAVPIADRKIMAVPTITRAADHSGWADLADAIEVTGLAMRALAVLEDIDVLSLDEFGPWSAAVVEDDRLVADRLTDHPEHDVRWAIRAAAV